MRLPTNCPKCQREHRPGEAACARCGLLVVRWEGYAEAAPTEPAVDAAWQELRAAWHDEDRHRAFLELAAARDALDVAAAHYRHAAREAPPASDVAQRAQRGLERAARMAQNVYVAKSLAARTPISPLWRGAALAVVLIVGIALAWMVLTAWRAQP